MREYAGACWKTCEKLHLLMVDDDQPENEKQRLEIIHKLVNLHKLDLILDPTVGKMGMLAMRILTSSGKIYLEYVISKVREETEARKGHIEAPR